MRALVTGGAGFIGSHLVDRLLAEGREVVVYDNFSSGKREFIDKNVRIVEADMLDTSMLNSVLAEGFDEVFHLAANPDVRIGAENTKVHLEQNIMTTFNLIEAMRKAKARRLGFASTSTIYGEATKIPTPEDYGPLLPISNYGASKLACEALISSYSNNFGIKSVMWRFANIVGPRSTHGITFDFINKLKADPKKLSILGDGKQTKSYCYVQDAIDAMMHTWERAKANVEVFNVGSEDYIDVNVIAKTVINEMGLKDVKFEYTGGVDGGRGWKGDIKVMKLSIDKLKDSGWKPKYDSVHAIKLTAKSLLGK